MSQYEHTSLWWPEERIKSTLNAKYIVSRLRPENIPRLFELPDWGEGLTSETYMEWILTKAGRVFMILDAIGIPDRIFALVDESCDDDDLPVAEHSVDLLHLSPHGEDLALEASFFHAQWRFLVRGIAEGEHIVSYRERGRSCRGVDRVVLAGSVCRVYMRTQVQVGGAPYFFSSDEVLAEIRNLKRLSHDHIVSVYASYLKDDSVSVLFTGATADRNLHSFLTDEPMSFKRLDKEQRRQILITWPHCLASAVSWLHARGHSHGAIRPSNIFVDANFHICLGQFQALDSLLAPPHVNDLEAYNYSAPERWARPTAPVVQQKPQPAQTLLPSGGRTKRRQRPTRLALAPLNENESPPASPDHARPDSAASKRTAIRIGLPGSPSRFSFAFSSSSSSSESSAASSTHTDATATSPQPRKHRISSFLSRRTNNTLPTPSITSSSTSSSNTSATPTLTSNPHPASNTLSPNPPSTLHHSKSTQSLTQPSTRPQTSQTSRSYKSTSTPNPQQNPNTPADIFSLAATTLDILTVLHKRTLTSFSAHRSARNRSAGRGGGIADASFHLARNAVQVQSWIALLEGDALKRCRRDRCSDRVFWAVPRMLIVVRAMLDFESGKRPLAKRVRRGFADAITRGGKGEGDGMGVLHCGREKREGGEKGSAVEVGREMGVGSAVSVVSSAPLGVSESGSVSEFDFGFGDAGSGSESESNIDDGDRVDVDIEEEDVSEVEEPERRVEQVLPQLYLPELDMNITGMEGLSFNN
ncbi:hypothetical protein N7519_011641 [Penicillium mononematosum]|uniref:uncharacterized protein n=1 Tax=Penicillium mononematosum TaxID=268346 RepID=UPI0025496515|nr:uncharacterized protein N7519_011641 [Penicillium mononematosum]KAJ6181180.1 hypothetical protein N7519_011641 [Penicillium mononematosum]